MTGFAPLGSTAIGQASTNANYQLQVTTGTFTLSMQGAAKLITDVFPNGTYTLSGQSVGFSAGRPSTFTTGSYTLIGNNVNLDYGFGIIANNGTFSLTGQNIVFEKGFGMVLASEVFTLTGQSIDFKKDMNVSAATGTFTLTGQDALKGVSEAFERGQFTYTGQNVTMFAGRFLRPETSQFSYNFEEFKIRGWFSPTVPAEIWTDAA